MQSDINRREFLKTVPAPLALAGASPPLMAVAATADPEARRLLREWQRASEAVELASDECSRLDLSGSDREIVKAQEDRLDDLVKEKGEIVDRMYRLTLASMGRPVDDDSAGDSGDDNPPVVLAVDGWLLVLAPLGEDGGCYLEHAIPPSDVLVASAAQPLIHPLPPPPAPEPDPGLEEIARAVRAFKHAVVRLVELKPTYDDAAEHFARDPSGAEAFERMVWEPVRSAADEAEKFLLDLMRARGIASVRLNGRVYTDSRASLARFDGFDDYPMTVEMVEVAAIVDLDGTSGR